MDEARHPTRRFRALIAAAGLVLALLAGLWIERRRIAGDVLDRRLAAAGVPASYRITHIDPVSQTIADVRLGDPAHPDLVARRLTITWRYGLTGPVLAGVRAEGVRLSAQWRNGKLSLGAIDGLLPGGGSGGPALPDLALDLRDTHIALLTPAGMVGAWIEGSGNAARDFAGTVRADAPALAIGPCAIEQATARLAVRVADRAPRVDGPLSLGRTICPASSAMLGPGAMRVALQLPSTLDRVRGTIAPAGFGGRVGGGSIGGVRGTLQIDTDGKAATGTTALIVDRVAAAQGDARSVSVAGTYRIDRRHYAFTGDIGANGVVASAGSRRAVGGVASASAGTQLAPVGARLGGAIGAFLAGFDARTRLTLDHGDSLVAQVERLAIRAADGRTAIGSGRFSGGADDWAVVADVAGGDLPRLHIDARRPTRAAPVTALLTTAPFAADGASLALTPVRIVWASGETRFATTATLTGPLGTGRIEGLAVPIVGRLDTWGNLRVGDGCNRISVQHVRFAAIALDPARLTLCGAPILTRGASGAVTIAATANAVTLDGTSGSAPATLRVAAVRLSGSGFHADRVAVTLGDGPNPTRLEIGALAGATTPHGATGTFADATGSIGTVPLLLSGAAGDWRLEGAALRLTGGVRVSDRATPARFLPLASRDVDLALVDGRIDAAATLTAPKTGDRVARVTLRHDLASGAGGADIAVPGIGFARKGLQPEMLTPLTLGVVANVVGSVAGDGRIDWTPAAVTSTGSFHTDHLDLAAAFGPVTGLAGTLRFTDLLALMSAPHQEARIAAINPGVEVADGVAHYQLLGGNRVQVEDARWPFAGGALTLDPATLDFSHAAERRMTFRVMGLDAAAFIQQLDFPNVAATGTFDGLLPMIFDDAGGRIEGGNLASRGAGTLAYVGELSNANLGTMGKLAFDALKAIRYSRLDVTLGGSLDGEIVTRVRFDGVRQATGDKGLVARMIRDLPFRFNIAIRAPFRGLVGSARSYADPSLLLQQVRPAAVQPADSAPVR